MKKFLLGLSLFLTLGIVSCSDDKATPFIQPELSIVSVNNSTSVAVGNTLKLKAKIKGNTENSTFHWTVNNTKVDDKFVNMTDSTFSFIEESEGKFSVNLIFEYEGQKFASTALDLTVLKSFAKGTFILNEGRMGFNGSLIYINPAGEVIADAYYEVNGKYLGDVCQDLFIRGDKMYIIAQNGSTGKEGEKEGKLVIADAKTLKRIDSFQEELGSSWTTHLAVLDDENIFVNVTNSISKFSLSTKSLTPIEGTTGADKTRMAVVGDKVYVVAKKSLLELEANNNKVVRTLAFEEYVQSVIPSYDGNLWVAVGNKKIAHVDAKSLTVKETKEITKGDVSRGFAATPSISAYKDEIYYSGTQSLVYVFNFKTGVNKEVYSTSKETSDTVIYQNIQVNPITGAGFMTTIKGFGGDYVYNNIHMLKHDEMNLTLDRLIPDILAFPAGVFFPEAF